MNSDLRKPLVLQILAWTLLSSSVAAFWTLCFIWTANGREFTRDCLASGGSVHGPTSCEVMGSGGKD